MKDPGVSVGHIFIYIFCSSGGWVGVLWSENIVSSQPWGGAEREGHMCAAASDSPALRFKLMQSGANLDLQSRSTRRSTQNKLKLGSEGGTS